MTFWQKYESLCEEKGVSPSGSEMVGVTGVSSAGIIYWKTKDSSPKDFKIYEKLAKYFEVDIRYLLGLSDYKYGEDIIEDMSDKLMDSGVDINSYDDDNGEGQKYILTYEGKSFNYQEHEFKALCNKLRVILNDTELFTVDKFCRETFMGEPSITHTERILFDEDEQYLLNNYRKLSKEGKIMVNSAIIAELRRQE